MGSTRRLLIVSRESPPALGPHPIRIAKLAKYLPEFGWDPVILTTPVDHAWYIDHELEHDLGSTEVIRVPRMMTQVATPTRGQVGSESSAVCRLDSVRRIGRQFRSGLAQAVLLPDPSILWAIPAGRRAAAVASRFDAVLTSGPPFSTHLVGDSLHINHGVPWVAEYRDNWTANPLYRRNPLLQRTNTRLERRLLAHAGAVVVVSTAAAEEMVARFPGLADRTYVAMNGYDPDDIPDDSPRATLFEIVHTGTLDERRDPRPFFDALRGLASENDEFAKTARLHLLGNMPAWVAAAARASLGDDHVQCGGLVSHREALLRASRAAMLVGITTAAEAGTAGLTSKLFEYMALRRPILMLAPDGPARALVSSSGAGLVADPDDIPGMVAAIRQLHQEWARGESRSASIANLESLTRRETARHVSAALSAACDSRQSAQSPEPIQQ